METACRRVLAAKSRVLVVLQPAVDAAHEMRSVAHFGEGTADFNDQPANSSRSEAEFEQNFSVFEPKTTRVVGRETDRHEACESGEIQRHSAISLTKPASF